MLGISRFRQSAILASAGAVALGLACGSPAQSTTSGTAATLNELKIAQQCQWADMVYTPNRSDFPDTPQGRAFFKLQRFQIERAITCLVNQARAGQPNPLKPLQGAYSNIRRNNRVELGNAAQQHADEAARLRWWGTVAEVGNCVPRQDKPELCDPHIHPVTKTTPGDRAWSAGYGPRCRQHWVGENAYTGPGREAVTPRAAFTWWMKSDRHRQNILDPRFRHMVVSVAWGSANPADGSITPALTYVQMFGRCDT
ncbi:CAP domain-containing protein [Nonomuraea sp. NPDC050153]|uniref:CAP domain-containing protein n=1 Tax=Nonomuraea sp. NPDC050153 TaxID=3364359 RepID=UPI00379361FE